MLTSEFKRKLLFFGIAILIFILSIFAVEFVEPYISDYFLRVFQFKLDENGAVISAIGGATEPMSLALSKLVINLFPLIKIFLWMAMVIAVVRLITFVVFGTALRNSQRHEIGSLVKTVVSVIIYIISFFIIFQAQYPKIELAPLFTGSTIVGIVVGLALQDTLGNLFAGIALQADQSFQIGDVINIPGKCVGVVESVSWRGVKVRTFKIRSSLSATAFWEKNLSKSPQEKD